MGRSRNIDLDPLFENPLPASSAPTSAGDYRLQAGSPCIDTGDNNGNGVPSEDIVGTPRPQDGDGNGSYIVDMGAYEYTAQQSTVDITTSLYDYVNDTLEVVATSPNGSSAFLKLVGFGQDRPMNWRNKDDAWKLTIDWNPAPATVTVCGDLDG